MTDPITPPPELVQQWIKECDNPEKPRWQEYEQDIANQSAQWGWDQRGAANEAELQKAADQELKECCLLLDNGEHAASYGCHNGPSLLLARRPKPPSLNSIALRMLGTIESDGRYLSEITDTIRRALEALPND